ncbi:hypothetical protein, partial [Streptomyces kunmingensis]|uniref:hypothetical protein n=1 Tax=Streptomyces kunmingensis TaxID=68225 RepID=UPI002D7903BB
MLTAIEHGDHVLGTRPGKGQFAVRTRTLGKRFHYGWHPVIRLSFEDLSEAALVPELSTQSPVALQLHLAAMLPHSSYGWAELALRFMMQQRSDNEVSRLAQDASLAAGRADDGKRYLGAAFGVGGG